MPDAELLIRRYLDSPSELVEHRGEGDETPMAVVNTYFRQRYEHQFMYDWPTMERMVSSAGFGSAERASFGKGSCRDLVLDDPKYEWESLYVDVLKAQSDPAKGKGA